MFLSFCGKTPRDEGAAFVAPSATVQGDVVLKPGSTVWYGAVLRGDDGTLTIGKNSNVGLTPTCWAATRAIGAMRTAVAVLLINIVMNEVVK